MPLTDIAVRQAKARERAYKLSDGSGLCLLIQPNGSKWWRFRYRWMGREKMLSVGVYPAISLAQARQRRDDARRSIAKGQDPAIDRLTLQRASAEDSFESVARHYLASLERHVRTDKRSYATYKKARWILERVLFPDLAERPIGTITSQELLTVLKKIEDRGLHETALRAKQRCGQIFRHAIGLGHASRDLTVDLRGLLERPVVTHHASLIDPIAVGILLRKIYSYSGRAETCCALKLAPLLFVRPGELRRAEWQHFDFGSAEWRIPAKAMKMRTPHIVPLSTQSLGILEELKSVTGGGQYLFPALGNPHRTMSENTVNKALRLMGYVREKMTGHGFRSMAATLLNEQGWDHDAIERQLAHTERDGVRAAYNYAQHLALRREMMQAWADYLDQLRNAKPEDARSIRVSAPAASAVAAASTTIAPFGGVERLRS